MEMKTRYLFFHDFFDAPLQFSSIEILQIGRRYCVPTEHIKPHAHLDFYELTVVSGGNGVVGANGEVCPVKAGDVFLSFPYDLHEIKANDDCKLEYDFLSFRCLDKELRDELKKITQSHFGAKSHVVQNEKIAELVQNALTEYFTKNQPFRERALNGVFDLLLLTVIRSFLNVEKTTANVSDAEILCFKIMNYIDTHVYSLETLESVAAKFNYSYGYLSGFFKRTTGKNLSEYYLNKKMETAKALILENKKKISEIAESLHYSPYSFSKAFKLRYGVSPKSMQAENKKAWFFEKNFFIKPFIFLSIFFRFVIIIPWWFVKPPTKQGNSKKEVKI